MSFDDSSVDAWLATQPMFATYGAQITFFVSRYGELTDAERGELHTLAAAGHDIEAHSVQHLRGPDYVEVRGLGAYLDEEVVPSITRLRDDGFDVVAYAYPFGARTSETDDAILQHVTVLRSVVFSWPEVSSPCPL
jgi:peptidoglycan/xylan/chitin deacetylase (PgdA/CDA1 family)